MVEFHRDSKFRCALTNWVGPGFSPPEEEEEEEYEEYANDYVLENWQGPHITAAHSGVLYFLDGKIQWRPRPDLTLATEGLLAMNGTASVCHRYPPSSGQPKMPCVVPVGPATGSTRISDRTRVG